MSASTVFLATRVVTMVSVKYSVFSSRILDHVDQSALWRHHGHENIQLEPALCQRKVSDISVSQICKVRHSTDILGKRRNIGIYFSGILTRWFIYTPATILTRAKGQLYDCHGVLVVYSLSIKLKWVSNWTKRKRQTRGGMWVVLSITSHRVIKP